MKTASQIMRIHHDQRQNNSKLCLRMLLWPNLKKWRSPLAHKIALQKPSCHSLIEQMRQAVWASRTLVSKKKIVLKTRQLVDCQVKLQRNIWLNKTRLCLKKAGYQRRIKLSLAASFSSGPQTQTFKAKRWCKQWSPYLIQGGWAKTLWLNKSERTNFVNGESWCSNTLIWI